MGLATRHRGWNYDQQYAILGAVLKGSTSGSQALGANTADQDAMLVGTPVTAASPVDTILISNTMASGDIVLVTLLGGTNSTEVMRVDTSAGLIVFNEASADWDLRVEGDNNANMLVLDGGTDSAAMGRAVVTGAFLSLDGSTVNRAPVTSVGLGVHLPAATYTKPAAASATTAIVPLVYIGTPTMVASTNTATYTDAITVYVAGAPSASTNVTATRTWASVVNGRFGVGAPTAIVHDLNTATLAVLNEQGADIDTRIEGDNNSNMLVIDAGTDTAAIGRAVVSGAFLSIDGAAVNRTQVTSVGTDIHLPAATINDVGAAATKAIWGRVVVGIPTLTSTNAMTYTNAAALYIAGVPAASTNVTLSTAGYAIWVDAGPVRFDGATVMNTISYTWPAADGNNGEQLSTNAAGVLAWTAASSSMGVKERIEDIDAFEALERIIATPVKQFHYREGMGTLDTETQYVGPMAEEAPWAMHHNGKIVNPVNTLGYSVLGMQALATQIKELQAEIKKLKGER